MPLVSRVPNAGRACPGCGLEVTDRRFERAYQNKAYVSCKCGKHIFPDEVSFDTVIRQGFEHLHEPDAIRARLWHHATKISDWEKQMPMGEDRWDSPHEEGRLMLHVGSRKAATERARHELYAGYWLYTFRVSAEAAIVPGLGEDTETFPMREHSESRNDRYLRDAVSAYVNMYESPGSVSLYGRVDLFEVVSRRFIRLAPAK